MTSAILMAEVVVDMPKGTSDGSPGNCIVQVAMQTVEISNLNMHRDSKICQENKVTKAQPPQKKEKRCILQVTWHVSRAVS